MLDVLRQQFSFCYTLLSATSLITKCIIPSIGLMAGRGGELAALGLVAQPSHFGTKISTQKPRKVRRLG